MVLEAISLEDSPATTLSGLHLSVVELMTPVMSLSEEKILGVSGVQMRRRNAIHPIGRTSEHTLVIRVARSEHVYSIFCQAGVYKG